MSSYYKGMRWLKCDLHMHTPADKSHWREKHIEEGQEATAKVFADACYQQHLDVVAITDHNFLSKDFIPYLQTAFNEIEQNFRHKITLFPGFEFEAAGVGKGVHVLCLFDPKEDLTKIDSILTECGIRYPRKNTAGQLEKSDKNLKDILHIIQEMHGGLVILPHAMGDDGIFDNNSISEWLQQDQFTNPDLLAVEISKPVQSMSSNFQKLFNSGDDCSPEWKRIRPIAKLMSSDNKKLIDLDEHGKANPNSIGYRYSWIKMSDPSIESLRQAFLDHESRIILPEDIATDISPAKRTHQTVIKSISIKNAAFLADQQIFFSPNMNCIIGGRGSGKSTLLEYLRIVLCKDKSEKLDKDTVDQINRVRGTLSESTEVELCLVNADGVEDRIVWQNGKSTVQDRELADPATFFASLPIRFYSQHQINRLTESEIDGEGVCQAQRLLELVDGFTQNELVELDKQEQRLKQQIQDAFSNLRKAEVCEKDCKRLQQEHQELDRQWKARSEIQEDARRHQLLKAEARYLDGLAGTPGKQFTDVVALAEAVATSHVAFQSKDSVHESWFRQFDRKVKEAKDSLAQSIRDAVEQFEATVDKLKLDDPEWEIVRDELEQADAKFSEACAAKGLTIDDVGHLQEIDQARTKKQRELDAILDEIGQLKEKAGNIELLIRELHNVWMKQFQVHAEAAKQANKLAILKESGQRFIEVSVGYQRDYRSFCECWQSFAPRDGRTRLARNWEQCGKSLYDFFTTQESAESPWQVLECCLLEEQRSAGLYLEQYIQDLFQHIQDNLDRWEKLRCSRVQDAIDMRLFRADGTVAGSIAEGSLSDGQRNTATLALLLAQKGGPLIIDQPEDELDSNFVFRELIPMLRKVKSNRQFIMATHNANLPVNGDAELVYAVEARDGKGTMLTCGGLDQASVTTAVLDIMEGSEEAFRRRREKYHF